MSQLTETPSTATKAGEGESAIPGGHVLRNEQPTSALVGVSMTSDHRYFWNGQGPYPSVTTILRVLDKPALTNWKLRGVAAAAFRKRGFVLDDEAEYVKVIIAESERPRDDAASLGSSVHLLADLTQRAQEGADWQFEIPDGTQPYLDAWKAAMGFLEAHRAGVIVSSEKAVLNLSERFAGTYDLLMLLDGELWLLDIKTGKGVYPDYALQLAGYAQAEYIVLPNDPTLYPMPKVQRYGILHLRPDAYAEGWKLVEFDVNAEAMIAFQAAHVMYSWLHESASKVIVK